MIEITKKESLILNFRENWDGDLFIIFTNDVGGHSGILKAEMRERIGEIQRGYNALISYFQMSENDPMLIISNIENIRPSETSDEPVF